MTFGPATAREVVAGPGCPNGSLALSEAVAKARFGG